VNALAIHERTGIQTLLLSPTGLEPPPSPGWAECPYTSRTIAPPLTLTFSRAEAQIGWPSATFPLLAFILQREEALKQAPGRAA
jgi:hypothetical protein